MDTTILLLGLAVLGLIVVMGYAAWRYTSRRRRAALRERFGPEYDRTVRAAGGTAKADAILQKRARRVQRFQIRPLSSSDHERFSESWRRVQALFVDDPGEAVAEADRLIVEVMRTRGYPVEQDFDRRADDLSVHHAHVVEHYRAGRHLASRHAEGDASTEDQRQAMVHFRELFQALVASGGERDTLRTRRAS